MRAIANQLAKEDKVKKKNTINICNISYYLYCNKFLVAVTKERIIFPQDYFAASAKIKLATLFPPCIFVYTIYIIHNFDRTYKLYSIYIIFIKSTVYTSVHGGLVILGKTLKIRNNFSLFQGKSYELDYFGCTEQNYVEETSSDGSLKGVGKK